MLRASGSSSSVSSSGVSVAPCAAPVCLSQVRLRQSSALCYSSVQSAVSTVAVQAGASFPPALVAAAAVGVVALAGAPLARAITHELRPRRCRVCLGSGSVVCAACVGRGRCGFDWPGEPPASEACDKCGRRGLQPCGVCRATGLSNYWLWSPAKDGGWGVRGSL
jgi:hypothetical protein